MRTWLKADDLLNDDEQHLCLPMITQNGVASLWTQLEYSLSLVAKGWKTVGKFYLVEGDQDRISA